MRHTSTYITILCTALFLPFSAEAAGTVSAHDAIAGLGITVTVERLTPSADIGVVVTDPEGTQTRVPAKTDATGNATVNVNGKYTHIAGAYNVHAEERAKQGPL